MTNRRVDGIYLLGFLAVVLIGTLLAQHASEEPAATPTELRFDDAGVELPEVEVELPEPVFVIHRSERRAAPRPPGGAFADLMESALSRVRTELLGATEASGPVAASERHLASARD